MRWVHAGVVLLGLVGVAEAGGDKWDGAYARESGGGTELCPDVDSVTVTRGAFSIDWTIRYQNARKLYAGRIEGTISATGAVTVKAKVFDPLAAQTASAVQEMGDSVDDLAKIAANMKMRVQTTPTRRLSLASGSCYASWDGGAGAGERVDDAPSAKPRTTKPDKATKPTTPRPVAKKPPPSATKPASTAPAPKPSPAAPASKPSPAAPKPSPPAAPAPKPSPPPEPKPAPKPKKNLAPGARCDEDEDCESDTCTFGQCYGRHGKPEFTSGSRCMHDDDCASGSCHDTCK